MMDTLMVGYGYGEGKLWHVLYICACEQWERKQKIEGTQWYSWVVFEKKANGNKNGLQGRYTRTK